jgi:two-component system, LytTR family, sensor kinase
MTRRAALVWLAVSVWWTLQGLVTSAGVRGMRDAAGQPMTWSHSLAVGLASAWIWVPLTMGLIWLVHRFPLERGRVLGALGPLVLAVAAILVLRAGAVVLFNPWIGWYDRVPAFDVLLRTSVANNLFLSWLIIGVAHALLFGERAHERERQAILLQGQLAEARLEALSAQLNPHFLFNALNSIAELVHQNAEDADRMLVGLGALLRRSLESGRLQEVPLGEELQLLDHYVDLERVRLGDRLRIDWQIDAQARDAAVPPLVLQPLVENAVRHAIARRAAPGLVCVRAMRERHRLVLEVENDGGGSSAAAVDSESDSSDRTNWNRGVGLTNTCARLECLYGANHEFRMTKRPAGGTVVRLDLPFRPVSRLEKAG